MHVPVMRLRAGGQIEKVFFWHLLLMYEWSETE